MFNRSKRNLKNKKGFTLIELVVVVAVIGILAAIAIPRVTGIVGNAKTNATNQTIAILNSSLERYIAEGNELDDEDDTATEVIKVLQDADYLSDDPIETKLSNGKFIIYNETKDFFEQNDTAEGSSSSK